MDSRYFPSRPRIVNASTITSSKLFTEDRFKSASNGVAYFAPRFTHENSPSSSRNTSSRYSYNGSSPSWAPSPPTFHPQSLPARSKSASPTRFTRVPTTSRPLPVRSRSAPASFNAGHILPTKRTWPKPPIKLASETNLQDRKDEIGIQKMLLPQNTLMDVTIVFITATVALFCSYFSLASYFPQTQEDLSLAWRSWRAGFRIRRQPLSKPKPTGSLYTTTLPWLVSSLLRLPTAIPTPSYTLSQRRDEPPVYVPSSDSISPPQTRGKGRKLALEPPPKALPTPPLKPWQHLAPGHHAAASSSSSSHSASSSVSRRNGLPKIDLQVKVARGMMKAFQTFREFFQYEVAAGEEMYDNPVTYEVARRVDGRQMPPLKLEMDETQPTIVTHRLYWQGAEEQVPQALSVAMSSLLSHMSISNCALALEDVIEIIGLSPSLQSFEVDRITPDAKALGPALYPTAVEDHNRMASLEAHNLNSLIITSYVPLHRIFHDIRFKRLHLLSLRLRDDGNSTDFSFMASSVLPRVQQFKLRGCLPPIKDLQLRQSLRDSGIAFDIVGNHTTISR